MEDLKKIICNLVSSNKEGDYWDFKQCYANNPHKLVKAIICLANNIRHRGDRYLIYGVNDKEFKVVGVENSPYRLTQSNLINTLSNAGFSGNVFPDVFLKTITLDSHEIDVIIIKDLPEKPYYLRRQYKHGKDILSAGTIYSRVRDSNTSDDQVASDQDIISMWRQRFGLDQTVMERLENYLEKYDEWEEIKENNWYFKKFPEFTVEIIDTTNLSIGDSWTRLATNPVAFEGFVLCKYHQTILWRDRVILYDEGRMTVPAPKLGQFNNKIFYYYLGEGIKFSMLQFLTKTSKSDLLNNGLEDGRCMKMALLFFKGKNEFERFKKYYLEDLYKKIPTENYCSLIDHLKENTEDPIHQKDIEVLKYTSCLKKVFDNWRENKGSLATS